MLAAACPSLTFPNVFFTPTGPPVAATLPGAAVPQVTPAALPANALAASVVHGLTPDFVEPLVHEGGLTVERQLPWHSSLSIGYLFSRGERLPVFLDGNLNPPTTTESYNLTDVNGNVTQTLGPFPFYSAASGRIAGSGVILLGESMVNSWYNALVVTYRKPISNGLEMLLNYTFSKAEDDGMAEGNYGSFFGTDYPINPHNQTPEWSRSDLDQTHRFTGSIVWIPQYFNKLSSRVGRAVLNGWALSTVATVATGQPVTADVSGNPSNGLDGGLTGGVVNNSGTAATSSNRAPWLGRNTFQAPNFSNVDLRLARDIPISENVRLRFVADAFNLFNETIVSGVNTTAFNYTKPGSTISGTTNACPPASSGNGCLTPVAPGLASSFLADSQTSDFISGSRQLQFSVKLIF